MGDSTYKRRFFQTGGMKVVKGLYLLQCAQTGKSMSGEKYTGSVSDISSVFPQGNSAFLPEMHVRCGSLPKD